MSKKVAKGTLLFSEEDSDLQNRSWRFDRRGYARCTINKKPSPPETIFAHHIVCLRAFGKRPNWSKKEVCDHINRNKMDNRRENLRIISCYENGANKGDFDPSPKVKYATLLKFRNIERWQCQLSRNGKSYYLGVFNTAEESREAALKFIKEKFNEIHP